MDWELLQRLGIESEESLESICKKLEEHQIQLLSAIKEETNRDNKKKMKEDLKLIDLQIKVVKENIISSKNDNLESKSKNEVVNTEKEELLQKLNKMKQQESLRREREESSKENNSQDDSEEKRNVSQSSADDLNKPEKTKEEPPKPQIDLGVQEELQEGINAYNQQNYALAYVKFYKLANDGNLVEAKYYLSILYKNGQGTSRNNERFEFWLSEAAKEGYSEAEYAYAKVLLNSHRGDKKAAKEGMEYLAKAADKNFSTAIIDYINVVSNGYNKVYAIKKARQYCARKVAELTDQYEQQQFRNRDSNLKKLLFATNKMNIFRFIKTTFEIAGPILLILGFIYWFGGMHPDVWTTNVLLRYFIDIPTWWIIPINNIWIYLVDVMNTNGEFGLQLICLSSLMLAGCNIKMRYKQSWQYNLYLVSKIVAIGFYVWHVIARFSHPVFKKADIVRGTLCLVVACGVGLLIGKLVNMLTKLDQY